MRLVPVFFSNAMVSDAGSFSQSPLKPARVFRRWQELAFPIDQRRVVPATSAQLERVHAPDMVAGVLAGRRSNGFGNTLPEVAASLPYTSGAMLQAAHEALQNGQCAVSPTSGFHHAGYDFSGGYCTFNGLMVAAASLRALHPDIRVGVLDCDQHDGNGTDDIIDRLGLDWVDHENTGAHGYRPRDAERFLESLPVTLQRMKQNGCAVLLYQAGADPHINDPLGGFLTDEQLEQRDRIVFETCRALKLPVAWNLAGGYREDANGFPEPVIRVHVRTMQACVDSFVTGAEVA